jgi:hypothetical protein
VPHGLGALPAAQRAPADFLCLDDDLLAIAAQTCPPLDETADLTVWLARPPVAEKDQLLRRVVRGEAARVRRELLLRFRGDTAPTNPVPARRTVAELLDDAARRRAERERRLAAQRAEDAARREQAHALARERRLDALAGEEDAAWSRVEAMIATRKPAEYDDAVTQRRIRGGFRVRRSSVSEGRVGSRRNWIDPRGPERFRGPSQVSWSSGAHEAPRSSGAVVCGERRLFWWS